MLGKWVGFFKQVPGKRDGIQKSTYVCNMVELLAIGGNMLAKSCSGFSIHEVGHGKKAGFRSNFKCMP